MAVYLQYINAVGVVTFIILTFLYLLFQVSSSGSAVWLSMWTDDKILSNITARGSDEFVNQNNMYLAIYGLLGLSQSK